MYSLDQIQAAVDRGQITPMQATDLISRQNAQAAAVRAQQMAAYARRAQTVGKDVEQYLAKHPKLRDPESPEFRKVADRARELSADLGIPADDLRIHRTAMRQVLAGSQPMTPKAAPATNAPPANKNDPLASIPKQYREHWEKWGYSREKMLAEAKYITRAPRTGR